MSRKLTEQEIKDRSILLADHVCLMQDAMRRKRDLMADLIKEIRFHSDMSTKIAQELNAGEVDEDNKLPF